MKPGTSYSKGMVPGSLKAVGFTGQVHVGGESAPLNDMSNVNGNVSLVGSSGYGSRSTSQRLISKDFFAGNESLEQAPSSMYHYFYWSCNYKRSRAAISYGMYGQRKPIIRTTLIKPTNNSRR